MNWVKVESLGDRVFLLGKKSSTSPATNLGVKGNSIYFYLHGYTSLYKFDMEDGTTTISLPGPKKFRHWDGPFWVVPNFKDCKRQVKKDVVKYVGEVRQESSWKELPSELLQSIMSLIYQGDCIRFRLTCKTWLSITPAIRSNPLPVLQPNNQGIPRLMSFPKTNKGVCNFYHPIYNDGYITEYPELRGAIIRDAKYGWLLMSQGDTSIFFFNPVTKESIKLPDIRQPGYCFVGISFSSSPTCSDCVVFGHTPSHRSFVDMVVYRKNEEDSEDKSPWSYYLIETKRDYEFIASYCNPVFYNGVFYCLSTNGELGIFNPKEEEENLLWRLVQVSPVLHLSGLDHYRTNFRNFIVECDGEIIAVFVHLKGKPILVILDSLGDKVIFLRPQPYWIVFATCTRLEKNREQDLFLKVPWPEQCVLFLNNR